jgi:hypothetical protein
MFMVLQCQPLPALLRKEAIPLQLGKITTHKHNLNELLRCSF